MSAIPEHLRRQVALRAGHRCEYCRLPQRGQVATFPIDHVVPRTADGCTELENLALACPHCNAHKWAFVSGTDPASGEGVKLFNPRKQAWFEHFRWLTPDLDWIEGVTAVGRATVAKLQMNNDAMIVTRRLLHELGAFSG